MKIIGNHDKISDPLYLLDKNLEKLEETMEKYNSGYIHSNIIKYKVKTKICYWQIETIIYKSSIILNCVIKTYRVTIIQQIVSLTWILLLIMFIISRLIKPYIIIQVKWELIILKFNNEDVVLEVVPVIWNVSLLIQ